MDQKWQKFMVEHIDYLVNPSQKDKDSEIVSYMIENQLVRLNFLNENNETDFSKFSALKDSINQLIEKSYNP